MPRNRLFLAMVFVSVSCGGGGSSPTPTPTMAVNAAPRFTSPTQATMDENSLANVYQVTATDSDGTIVALTLNATGDAGLFTFDSVSGNVSLKSRQKIAMPADANGDNIFELSFTARDNLGATATIAVRITLVAATLDPSLPPSGNFELIDWRLELPIDSNGGFTGTNITIQEAQLAAGYQSEWFFTGSDGAMVFKAPVIGAKTPNSSFTRTELREMLRRGNTSINARGSNDIPNGNNWAFSSQPAAAQSGAGGVDGDLRVTLAVNNVTTTGSRNQIGRFIIGQIHAKDNEPIRLYYRKLPGNVNGSIYAEHENSTGSNSRFEVVGNSSDSASNPAGGIPLNQRFSYLISARGNTLNVTVSNAANQTIGMTTIDMTNSGYDILNDFMYFKIGAYHVNNTADAAEFVQMSVYALSNSHTNYLF